MRPEIDVFTEHQLARGRFGSAPERLAVLLRINESDPDSDLFFGKDPQVDRVAIDNTSYASVDTDVLQAKSVCGRFERIPGKNAKIPDRTSRAVSLVSMWATSSKSLGWHGRSMVRRWSHTYQFN